MINRTESGTWVCLTTLKGDYARTIRLRLRENAFINTRVGTLANSDQELAENILLH